MPSTDADLRIYTLQSPKLIVRIIPYGGRIIELQTPDSAGKLANIVLGFPDPKRYTQGNPFFGALIGRYANRIAKGKFTLGEKTYQLPTNNGPNSLHGGTIGFDKLPWQVAESSPTMLRLTLSSPDGDMGYPGNLDATATYTLSDNALRIDYLATCDADTVINLTNHSYFNLAGPGGDILGHRLTLYADQYTPVDGTLIPTGEIAAVRGTPMDFTSAHTIGERIALVPGGYDHNYVLNSTTGALAAAARLEDPKSGRIMEVATTQPGIQFYSGNFLDGTIAGNGGAYPKNGACCLETQHFPDSPNRPNFPSAVLKKGEQYRQSATYTFSAH
jgi:aldose 1-epimerase